MTGEVYISGIYQMGELGDKLGACTKWHGQDWQPASFNLPVNPTHVSEAIQLSAKGIKISREDFPEQVSVWDELTFAKAHDFLWLSGFLTVKEKVADVLRRFDLGGGELVLVPLVKADLMTPWEDPFYYINYGGPKDSLLPEYSQSIRMQIPRQLPNKSTYNIPSDDDITLSAVATRGADIWVEEYVFSKLFLSGALVHSLHEAKIDVDLRLNKCRIVEDK